MEFPLTHYRLFSNEVACLKTIDRFVRLNGF